MNFLEAMRWVEEQHSFPEDPAHFHGERFAQLARLTDLFAGLPPIVVVTGSCGKASTARFLAFMLRAAGKRVGLGTKPPLSETPHGHLERYQLIDDSGESWLEPDLFARIVEPLPELARGLDPSLGPLAPYDLRAWILLRAFAEWKVDVGIVEANIGLRRDPAGAIPASLTVITPIATDHAQMLQAPPEWKHLGAASGPLWHKLSAVPSQRAVVGRQPSISPEELDRLLDRPGPRLGRDFELRDATSGLWGSRGVLARGGRETILELSCLGDFQLENAATAAVAFAELEGDDEEAVRRGAAVCQIPGRLEVMGREPLQLLCVASSKPKVQAMLDSLEALFENSESGMVLVCTLLDRIHGVDEVVRYLATHPRLQAMVVTEGSYPDDSKDLPAEGVAQAARRARAGLQVETELDPGRAIERGKALVGRDGLLLLLGNGLAAYASETLSSRF